MTGGDHQQTAGDRTLRGLATVPGLPLVGTSPAPLQDLPGKCVDYPLD